MTRIFNRIISAVRYSFPFLLPALILALCIWSLFNLVPDIWNLNFHEVKNYSVWELRNEKRIIEAKVSGNLDKSRYLVEEKGLTEKSRKLSYYYYLYNQPDKGIINGIRVYSPLPPEQLMKLYDKTPVTLHGIWEERSPILEHSDPATLADQVRGEMDKSYSAFKRKYKKAQLVGDDVFSALKEFPPDYKVPIEPKYSLNLTPVRPYKLEKLAELAIVTGFLGYFLLSGYRGYKMRAPK